MNTRCVPWLAAVVLGLVPLSAGAQEQNPQLALQVVRLRPGETKVIEFALPGGDFRLAGRSGRDLFYVHLFPKPGGNGEFVPVEREGQETEPYPVAPGLELRWSQEKPGVDLRAAKGAKPGTIDLRVTYASFGAGGRHFAGLRVVIADK